MALGKKSEKTLAFRANKRGLISNRDYPVNGTPNANRQSTELSIEAHQRSKGAPHDSVSEFNRDAAHGAPHVNGSGAHDG
jgi:hypothetical protein